MQHAISKLLREPLLIFLVLGALLFGLHTLVSDQSQESDDALGIQVTAANIDQLSASWQRQMGRPPQPEEFQGLIDNFVREEVLVRESLALGLDRDDTVIRRRLVQKMNFLVEDLALLNEPTKADVTDYFEQHPELYRLPPRISFTHIYFSRDRRGDATKADAELALSRLAPVDKMVNVAQLGDPFALPYDYSLISPREISQLFGQGFAEELLVLTPSEWQGPVESSYGLHLIQVLDRVEGHLPEISSVHDQVLRDLVRERRAEAQAQAYDVLRDRYEISITDDAVLAGIHISSPGSGG